MYIVIIKHKYKHVENDEFQQDEEKHVEKPRNLSKLFRVIVWAHVHYTLTLTDTTVTKEKENSFIFKHFLFGFV